MSVTQESHVLTSQSAPEINLTSPSDRRADIEYKQAFVANLLKNIGCDGLLVLGPENFSWLTGGGSARGIVDQDELPALYVSGDGRWLLCSNVDTQRLFDEEIDGLGFQLKEWPWHLGRRRFLTDLCQGATSPAINHWAVASSWPTNCSSRGLSSPNTSKPVTALGKIVSHALEATGRTLAHGETEREAAGQLSHRLIHRGATPLCVSVFADGRSLVYRQAGYTGASIQHYAVMTIAARKYGLCACASRTVVFGQPDAALRKHHDAACKVSANYVASSWPDSVPRQILASGLRIYQITGAEHEWALSPQGHLTGRAIVELAMTPRVEDLLQNNSAITWHSSVGGAVSCDTFLISEEGPALRHRRGKLAPQAHPHSGRRVCPPRPPGALTRAVAGGSG